MMNLSTERGSTAEKSKQSLLSKRTRGKVRLPPLSRRQLTRHIPQPEQIMPSEYKRNASLPFSPNLTSPHITESLLTSADHKCPRSPSNLSLQFNFEEPAAVNGQFVQSTDRLKAVNKNGQKRVTSSMSKTPRVNKTKPKGYHVLNNEEPITVVEKQTEYRKNRSNKITGTSNVKQKSKSHHDRTGTTVHPQSAGEKPFSETKLRLQTMDNRERKRSTYDLREFLLLPADNKQKINSMSGPHNKPKRLQHGEKNPVKLSPNCPKPKSSDTRTYDVFEFLQLSAESSRQLIGAGQKKLKRIRPQIASKGKSIESTKKPEIPSVIVADWSLNSDFPKTKKVIRPTSELPKANFPSEDFPKTPEHTPETEKTHRQRCSVYDLKEFLTLPDVAGLHSVRKIKKQDTKPRSSSLEEDSTRETDVKYDLAEFLNYLESGGSGSQSNSTNRERTIGDLTDLGLRNRSLSVYDVYEFLKVTSAKDLSGEDSTDNASQGQGKPSIIDVTKLVANSSNANKGRPLQEVLSPVSNNEKASRGSCYDLREFLTLPVTMEDSQNESQTNRGTAEWLQIT